MRGWIFSASARTPRNKSLISTEIHLRREIIYLLQRLLILLHQRSWKAEEYLKPIVDNFLGINSSILSIMSSARRVANDDSATPENQQITESGAS